MRREDWPERLLDVVNDSRHRGPVAWGRSDCFAFVQEAVAAVTGVMPYREERGRYDGPVSAARRLAERGFKSTEAALAALFPELPVALAQRGDIGIAAADGSPVIFEGRGAVGRGVDGLVRLSRKQVRRAFAVR